MTTTSWGRGRMNHSNQIKRLIWTRGHTPKQYNQNDEDTEWVESSIRLKWMDQRRRGMAWKMGARDRRRSRWRKEVNENHTCKTFIWRDFMTACLRKQINVLSWSPCGSGHQRLMMNGNTRHRCAINTTPRERWHGDRYPEIRSSGRRSGPRRRRGAVMRRDTPTSQSSKLRQAV